MFIRELADLEPGYLQNVSKTSISNSKLSFLKTILYVCIHKEVTHSHMINIYNLGLYWGLLKLQPCTVIEPLKLRLLSIEMQNCFSCFGLILVDISKANLTYRVLSSFTQWMEHFKEKKSSSKPSSGIGITTTYYGFK